MEKEGLFAKFSRKWGETYWKRIMTVIIVNAMGWIWCSYALAWRRMDQIADDLSKTALSAILGVVVAYAVKSTSENISKNGFVGKRQNGLTDIKPDSWTDIPEYEPPGGKNRKDDSLIDFPEDSEPEGGSHE